jgi:hypothetical protein
VRVRLWINDSEVKLPHWKDIHNLLKSLCTNPQEELRGRATERNSNITNASQAVTKIQKALEATWADAKGWLLTNPIRWADGRAPALRNENDGKAPL